MDLSLKKEKQSESFSTHPSLQLEKTHKHHFLLARQRMGMNLLRSEAGLFVVTPSPH